MERLIVGYNQIERKSLISPTSPDSHPLLSSRSISHSVSEVIGDLQLQLSLLGSTPPPAHSRSCLFICSTVWEWPLCPFPPPHPCQWMGTLGLPQRILYYHCYLLLAAPPGPPFTPGQRTVISVAVVFIYSVRNTWFLPVRGWRCMRVVAGGVWCMSPCVCTEQYAPEEDARCPALSRVSC